MESIWNFNDNDQIETDKVDLKPFKATGRFFEDILALTKLFNIKLHPALRESSYRDGQEKNEVEDDTMQKEIIALNFMKYRLDKNSLRTMFLCLPPAQNIQTLK